MYGCAPCPEFIEGPIVISLGSSYKIAQSRLRAALSFKSLSPLTTLGGDLLQNLI